MIAFILQIAALIFLLISALSKPVGKTNINALGMGMFLWLLSLMIGPVQAYLHPAR